MGEMMILIWILEIAMLIGGIVLSVIALAKGIERQQSNVTIWGAVGLVCGIVGIFLLTIVFGTVSLVCGAYAKSLLDKTGDNPSFEQYKREQAMKNDPQYQAYLRSIGQAPAAPAEDDFGLSAEEITRLRMKAKRNELTEDERLLYTEYLQSKHRGM